MSNPVATAKLKINKPVAEVFDAVINCNKLDKYFVSHASANMVTGTVVLWRWDEFGASGDTTVGEIVQDKSITFEWLGGGKFNSTVVLTFESSTNGQATLIKAVETGFSATPEGVDVAIGQTEGWMHMFCCMKAFLEHNVDLRAGGVWTLNN